MLNTQKIHFQIFKLTTLLKNYPCRCHPRTLYKNYRKFSSSHPVLSSRMRLRFAPSPTGYLHLGGLRTALYNYLAATASNGTFILRIEDTDRNRFVPGAAEALLDMLKWANIAPTEGYGVGGPRGPYVQSERKHLYQKYAQELVDRDVAYRCFCSPLRLELLRMRGGKSGSPVPYDNKCRSLSKASAELMSAQGTPHCVRLKLDEGGVWNDAVYGSVTYNVEETDPVILKSDGHATYHLASVVDDHLMGITHVIRGDEWLSSTPKHLLMYEALGWSSPVFMHLPLLLNTDGSKLSKRQDNLRVEQLMRKGYSARTLINLVAGSAIKDKDQGVIYTVDELVGKFSLSNVTKRHAKVDLDRLSSLGKLDFLRCVSDNEERSNTILLLQSIIKEAYGDKSETDTTHMTRVLDMFTARPVERLSQLLGPERAYLWCQPAPPQSSRLHLHALQKVYEALGGLESESFSQKSLQMTLKGAMKELQTPLKTSVFMQMLRLVLCGTQQGEPVAEVLELLGKEKSLRRLQSAVDYCHLSSEIINQNNQM